MKEEKRFILWKIPPGCTRIAGTVNMLLSAGEGAEDTEIRKIIFALPIMIFLTIRFTGWKKLPCGIRKITKYILRIKKLSSKITNYFIETRQDL